jgi:hypothetical protein
MEILRGLPYNAEMMILRMRLVAITRKRVKAIIRVESELIVVIVPRRMVPSTYIGRVSKPRPEVKNVMMKSSMDEGKCQEGSGDNPWHHQGKLDFPEYVRGLAPRSWAASTKE